ncbi:MAG TPA: hypothetical protein VGB57_12895, partial [Allosphingosinicella sp.]
MEDGVEHHGAKGGGTGLQLLGSLAAAAVIVALAIWAVTAKLGPTGIAGREAAEERAEAAEEAGEEAGEARGESGRNRRRG